jgi:hypothetical protein
MKKLFILSILLVVLVAGCTSQTLECNDPYIRVGSSCCLDINGNDICDSDESGENNDLSGLCSDVVCEDYCDGVTRYYNGQCSVGDCSYASQYCESGCEDGSCLNYNINDGICSPEEKGETFGCIDCISDCNNDHTQFCYHVNPPSSNFVCQSTSIELDDRNFFTSRSHENIMNTIDSQEFTASDSTAMIITYFNLELDGSSNNWETYLSNVKGDTICYTTTGDYAMSTMGDFENYKNISVSSYFDCANGQDGFCEVSEDAKNLIKFSKFKDGQYSPSAMYIIFVQDHTVLWDNPTERPITFECKIRIWSEDIPDDIQENIFKISFV